MEASKKPPARRPEIMATATSEVALVPLAGTPVLFDRESRITEHPLLAGEGTPSPVVNPFQLNMTAVVVLVANEVDRDGDALALMVGRAALAKIDEERS